MENILFVMWMVLYPIASSISNYYGSKTRMVLGIKPYSDEANFFGALVNIIIYFAVAKALYVN